MNTNIINLKINYEDVLVRMGANKHITKIDAKLKTLILEMIDLAKKLLQPKYAISLSKKTIKENKIYLNNFVINSKDILKLLEKTNSVCGIVATLGIFMDNKISSLLEQKEILQAFILDSIGSVSIEELMNNICDDIKKKYGSITMRFSPGYGDWTLTNQYDLLQWVGAGKIGINLSPAFQMTPRKSVSAIVGYNE